jgi:hypothetical protein
MLKVGGFTKKLIFLKLKKNQYKGWFHVELLRGKKSLD